MRWIILVILAAWSLCAQDAGTSSAVFDEKQEQKDYRLGAGDVVAISVLGIKDFDRAVPISNSGRMHVPYLGVLSVAGMTLDQLREEVGRRLRERGLLKNPWVQARVVDYRAHTVYILGEVLMPGQYVLKQDMYMMDLVSLGMGMNSVTSRTVYLYRQKPPAPAGVKPAVPENPYDVMAIDLQEVLNGKRPDLNIRLRGGDILYCPERKATYFYAVGDLNRPGAVEMPQNESVLVSRAISLAGGPSRTAKMSKSFVLRYDESGARQQLPVNFKKVLAGKQPDFVINPNDVIFVPGSSVKTLAYGILGIVPGVAQGVALVP